MVSSTAELMKEVIASTPEPLRTPLREVSLNTRMNAGAVQLMGRSTELGDPLRALLIGAMMDPASREHVNLHLDKVWWGNEPLDDVDEVIIGAGLHAAIYCATRAEKARREGKRHVRPLVLEAKSRVGGAFAVSENASFYTNSRSRPGGQGVPGEGGALNLLPHAVIQPFDLTSSEYAPNTAFADAVRLTLAMYADVVADVKIDRVIAETPTEALTKFVAYAKDTPVVRARRIIFATGIGEAGTPFEKELLDYSGVMGYYEFMRRMDEPFPLRGMKSVAVVGAGDSGKTVVEALIGQGPQTRMSVQSLDWVDRIDWYGVGDTNEAIFCGNDRSRYRNISRFLRSDRNGVRLKAMNQAVRLVPLGDAVMVDGRPYDHVIIAAGFQANQFNVEDYVWETFAQNEYVLGKKAVNGAYQGSPDNGVFKIGPAARLAVSEQENPFINSKTKANYTAVWRYAPRTVALAMLFEITAPKLEELKPVKPIGLKATKKSTARSAKKPVAKKAVAKKAPAKKAVAKKGAKSLVYRGFEVGSRVRGKVFTGYGLGTVVVRPNKGKRDDVPVKLDGRTGGYYGDGIYSLYPSNLDRISYA